MYAQAELEPLEVNMREIICPDKPLPNINIEFGYIFPSNVKLLPTTYVKTACYKINNVIATNAPMCEDKAGAGALAESLSWSCTLHVP